MSTILAQIEVRHSDKRKRFFGFTAFKFKPKICFKKWTFGQSEALIKTVIVVFGLVQYACGNTFFRKFSKIKTSWGFFTKME